MHRDFLHLEILLPAHAANARVMRHALRCFLYDAEFEHERASDIVLAVGEATSNAIEHAYSGEEGVVFLRADAVQDRLTVQVCDNGSWRVRSSEERGRGLEIMRALVDSVEIESSRNGTSVRFEVDRAFIPR